MSTLQIDLVLVIVVLLLVWLWLRQRVGGAVNTQEDRIDTVMGWPPKPTRVLSMRERIAFGILVRALPEYMILSQVPLARFLSVSKRNSYADWLRRVGYQCVDFVVCDKGAQVIAVIELRAPHASDRARKRLARMSRTLKAARIPLQVWSQEALPSLAAAREMILPTAVPAAEHATAADDATGNAALASSTVPRNPFDDSARDSTQDELIELLEPPPSTWYDDIDSTPMPLRKQ